jgi:dTDP-glucose 4,6-dehydratase
MKILVTGGCGFIGSNFIRHVLKARPEWKVVNLDLLTYAGNPDNVRDLDHITTRYTFIRGDIASADDVDAAIGLGIDAIVNFAAESHVDRSISGPEQFVRTNVMGTAVLLEAARQNNINRFLQISTDEVYGSLPPEGVFTETTPLHPNNPYSATKAAADHLVLAYVHTYGLPALITRSSNNYGPYQYPEKFIPLFITQAMEGKECPLYGSGANIRDWLHVEDNCRGILAALEHGYSGDVINLGGGNERANLDVANEILLLVGNPKAKIRLVQDRPGHDLRYALSSKKAKDLLGWKPEILFSDGLQQTVHWYKQNQDWINKIRFRKNH